MSSKFEAQPPSALPLRPTKEDDFDVDKLEFGENFPLDNVEKGGTSSVSTSIFNLCKSIIGAGVLSLPHGLAVYASDPKALLPAILLCALFAFASAYSFISIGTLCKETRSNSFREVWMKSMDPKSGWIISVSISLMCLLSCLAYTIVIAESLLSLLQTFSLFPPSFISRNSAILMVSIFVLLPLCSVRSLQALTPFSLLGILGSIYTAAFMLFRLFDHSYVAGGQFFKDLSSPPSFEHSYTLYHHSSFVLLSMFSTSYITHYNAPRFYHELKNPTPERFAHVTLVSFMVSMVFFILVMSSGFLTFGGSSQSFVLNNYSPHDSLATFARIATGLAVVTGYPFTFAAFRDNWQDLQESFHDRRSNGSNTQHAPDKDDNFLFLTLFLLSIITIFSLLLEDVGFVVGVSGALFGSWLLFIVPALMNISFFHRQMQQRLTALKMGMKRPTWTMTQRIELSWNYFLIGVGVLLMVVGLSVQFQRFLLL